MKTILYVGDLRNFVLFCRDVRDELLNIGITDFVYQRNVHRIIINDCCTISYTRNELQYVQAKRIEYVICRDEIILQEIKDRNPNVIVIDSFNDLINFLKTFYANSKNIKKENLKL